MVVIYNPVDLEQLDLAYLAFFLGRRVNELVVHRLQQAGFTNVRESHGYVIQYLIGGERSITDLSRRMGVTQQAASKTVADMIRQGVLEATPAADRRTKTIRISKRGWESVQFARRARTRIDSRLATMMSAESHERTKASLIRCIRALGGVKQIRSRRVREPR